MDVGFNLSSIGNRFYSLLFRSTAMAFNRSLKIFSENVLHVIACLMCNEMKSLVRYSFGSLMAEEKKDEISIPMWID
jgi:hypothetical protein